MTKILFAALTLLLICSGCETDIDVIHEADPTPIVYCILNQDSTTQYLRLSRSYLTDQGNIPIGEPDSVLFSRATKVAIEEMIGGEVTNRMFFTPFDVVKDSGFFPVREHWVYRAKFKVKPDTDYRLVIYMDEYDKIVYSTCYSVGNFDILNPLYPEVRAIHMLPDHNLNFLWTKSNNAAVYQIGFLMHYLEIGEDQAVEKKILIPLSYIFYLESTDNRFSYSINSVKFYQYLAKSLVADPLVLRKFLSLDALIISGGQELGYYINMQENDQIFSMADYSNIQSGVGVFSSKVIRKIDGFSLTEQSIDTLAYGKLTNNLNFVDRTGTRNR
ncbi:MAG: hypothetical protein PHY99_02205 [Bacteroidales bacterium]|nr:hypothetical protein [Bacteroidales bacterium]